MSIEDERLWTEGEIDVEVSTVLALAQQLFMGGAVVDLPAWPKRLVREREKLRRKAGPDEDYPLLAPPVVALCSPDGMGVWMAGSGAVHDIAMALRDGPVEALKGALIRDCRSATRRMNRGTWIIAGRARDLGPMSSPRIALVEPFVERLRLAKRAISVALVVSEGVDAQFSTPGPLRWYVNPNNLNGPYRS